jgi:hypothetical protein
VAAIVAVLCGVGAGVAYATGSIPGAGGVIQGCYDGGGNLKVVASLPCPKGYTALQWNEQGPPGTAGAPGTNGTNGTNGVSGYEIVSNTSTITSGEHGSGGVLCPAGKHVLGGGATLLRDVGGLDFEYLDEPGAIYGSYPNSDGTGWGELWNIQDPNGYVLHLKIYATCATTN